MRALFVMAHPLISCIVYATLNDNYHNQLCRCVGRMEARMFSGRHTMSCFASLSSCIHISAGAFISAVSDARAPGRTQLIGLKSDWQGNDIITDNDRGLNSGADARLDYHVRRCK